jgi:hypothetical protein
MGGRIEAGSPDLEAVTRLLENLGLASFQNNPGSEAYDRFALRLASSLAQVACYRRPR